MKKPQIKLEEYLKDLDSILEIVDKIDNLNLETIDLNLLKKISIKTWIPKNKLLYKGYVSKHKNI